MKRLLVLVITILSLLQILQSQPPLTLNDAIKEGLWHNYSILIQANNERIAQNNNTPGNAGMLPVVGLEAAQNNTINSTYQRTLAGTERDVANAQSSTFGATVALNWTVFDGFNMFVQRDMLGVFESMSELETRLVIENTVQSIILGYYGIVQQQEVIQVLNDAVALGNERHKVASTRLAVGSASKLALLQATVDLNTDSARLIQERAVLKNLQADLNLLMGRDPATPIIATDDIVISRDLSLATILEKALGGNTVLELSRKRMEMSALATKEAKAAMYPRIDLQASYGYNLLSAETGYLAYNRAFGPKYGVVLSYSLFNGLNQQREIKNLKVGLESANLEMQSNELSIRAELIKLYNEYESNLELIRLEELNQTVAEENVKVAFEKYRLGSISDIELRETQKKLIDAQYQLVIAKYNAKQAETGLRRISGELGVGSRE